MLRQRLGPYILIDPWSKHANLRWPIEHWTTLVALHPQITWIQHVYPGVPEDAHVPGALRIDTLSFRAACGLVAHADCYIRGESGMCHAAAALGIPQVTIWGACMDAEVMGGYAKQILVGVVGPYCGRYMPCDHCKLVMSLITPTEVADGLQRALALNSA